MARPKRSATSPTLKVLDFMSTLSRTICGMSMLQRLDAADVLPAAAELRARTYELLRLEPGSAVIDVGCGAGPAVSELSWLGFRAVGVDLSAEMLEEARRRSPDRDFLIGDAYALPVDGGFAGYRADKVFHELAEPEVALAEARRVLVPGGRGAGDRFLRSGADPGDRARAGFGDHRTPDRAGIPTAARRKRVS
ncbi:methyltransferase domain-containing protein [Amycolatopsis coloradensis]|uniref:Methyltransferase domain-containing protein n=1 Tax=Amycolatopsis coloradensis TaxID=76021 RepID=A0ACD5BCH6_9PSEU